MKKAPLLTSKVHSDLCFCDEPLLLWGIAITMGDLLNRRFQTCMNVSLADSGLVQFSIFGAYFVMGIPAGLFMKKYGYKNGVILGLADTRFLRLFVLSRSRSPIFWLFQGCLVHSSLRVGHFRNRSTPVFSRIGT